MVDPQVNIPGGVTGAKRVLSAISNSSDIKEIRECLRDLFVYELANEMKGSNRYKPEYEKRIRDFADRADKATHKAKS